MLTLLYMHPTRSGNPNQEPASAIELQVRCAVQQDKFQAYGESKYCTNIAAVTRDISSTDASRWQQHSINLMLGAPEGRGADGVDAMA
jgi:hypothetical protein